MHRILAFTSLVALCSTLALAQNTAHESPPTAQVSVPRLVRFSGTAQDSAGKPLHGVLGITFTLYPAQRGGAAVWIETQNVKTDTAGRYSALLGASKPDGLPTEMFTSGEAKWLGVQVHGLPEQPRVLLLSVPYALKAADAETLGGKPASAFVTRDVTSAAAAASKKASTAKAQEQSTATKANGSAAATPCTSITSDGTALANQVAKFVAPCKIQKSQLFDTGSAVGLGTTVPTATFDVRSAGFGIRGTTSSTTGTGAQGQATATTGITVGLSGRVASSSGIAGMFDNTAASGFAGAKILSLRNNGVERVGVLGNGNVGIGTGGNPYVKLDVTLSTTGDHDPIARFGTARVNDANA